MFNNKVLLFGGTFNPIHNGHLIMGLEALSLCSFNKVIFMPNSIPPHKKDDMSFKHRFKMIELAIEGTSCFEVSDIESKREGPSYALDTVEYFQKIYGKDLKIAWLVGNDTIKELRTWYKIKELLDKCYFFIAERNLYIDNFKPHSKQEVLNECENILQEIGTKGSVNKYFMPLITPIIEISSSKIRYDIYHNERYPTRFVVPEKVEKYIYDNRLYRNKQELNFI